MTARRQSLPVVAFVSWLAATGCAEPVHREEAWTAFGDGARAELYTVTERDAATAFEGIREAIEEIEQLTGAEGGELQRLNAIAQSEFYRVEERDLYRCLLLALDYARASRGAFDPTVGPLLELYRAADGEPAPADVEAALGRVGWDRVTIAEEARAVRFRDAGMRLELGGVAKGFSLDTAARAFTRTGNLAALISIGGNHYAWSSPPGQSDWTVELLDPRHAGRPLLRLRTHDRGVSVSGQGADILDPATGRPSRSDVLVAVATADSGGDADALSTALVVSGSLRGGDLLTRARQVEAVLLVQAAEGRKLLVSGSLEDRIELSAELESEVEGRVRYLLPPAGSR